MIYFNAKDKSRKNVNNKQTLDAIHNNKINSIIETKNNISKLEIELNKYIILLNEIKLLDLNRLSSEELKNCYLYDKKIKEISTKINYIKDNTESNKYLLNAGNLIFDYYDNNIKHNTNNKKESNNSGIMTFFNLSNKHKVESNNCYTNRTNNIDDIDDDNLNKADILKKYLTITDSNYKGNINYINKNICTICNTNLLLNLIEGISVCNLCGEQNYILIDSEKASYKDPPAEYNYFSYKRINHFSSWLAQLQSLESTDIPNDIIDNILIELKKQRIINIANITNKKIKEILKKLKLNKYYEHIYYIMNKINGIPPITIDPYIVNKLKNMFRAIQNPFIKWCPLNRKNFLSYSYCLHKFFQLLGMDQYMKQFPLLKSREKLLGQDIIWKNICKELGWPFFKSL